MSHKCLFPGEMPRRSNFVNIGPSACSGELMTIRSARRPKNSSTPMLWSLSTGKTTSGLGREAFKSAAWQKQERFELSKNDDHDFKKKLDELHKQKLPSHYFCKMMYLFFSFMSGPKIRRVFWFFLGPAVVLPKTNQLLSLNGGPFQIRNEMCHILFRRLRWR